MGTPLKNPPVYYTVAQVRFNPVLKLKAYLPDIQEGLRGRGYPDFRPESLFTVQFGPPGSAGAALQQAVTERFVFGNAEQTHSFVLAQDALTFQSTDYGHFEQFSESFLEGLATIHSAMRLDFVERVGLRYLDRIVPGTDERLEQYLAPEVLGTASRFDIQNAMSYAETRGERNEIKLVSRTILQTGPVGFPVDIGPVSLKIAPRFTADSGLHAVLDNDGFVERRETYSNEKVQMHLNAIHALISVAFRATVTDYAFQRWSR